MGKGAWLEYSGAPTPLVEEGRRRFSIPARYAGAPGRDGRGNGGACQSPGRNRAWPFPGERIPRYRITADFEKGFLGVCCLRVAVTDLKPNEPVRRETVRSRTATDFFD